MIWESAPWKSEIEHHRQLILRWRHSPLSSKGSFFLERGILVSAFAARKLFENYKVTDTTKGLSVSAQAYTPVRPLSGRVSRFHSPIDLTADYDTSTPTQADIPFRELCNQLIHSYALGFHLDDDQGRVTGIYVNSYRTRDSRLLNVDLDRYCTCLTQVCSDEVTSVRTWIEKSGKIVCEVK